MSYSIEVQQIGRVLRPRNQKAHLKFFEIASKGGRHEDKDGKHAKRAIQKKIVDEEIKRELKHFNQDE